MEKEKPGKGRARQTKQRREKCGKERSHVFSHLTNKTKWSVKQSGALQEDWKVLCGRRSSHQ